MGGSVCRSSQRPEALNSLLELGLQAVVGCLTWLWETNVNSLQEQRMFLTPEPFPQSLIHVIVYNDNSSIFLCDTSLHGINVWAVWPFSGGLNYLELFGHHETWGCPYYCANPWVHVPRKKIRKNTNEGYQDIYEGTGETVQRLRALVALGEVLGLVSSTHIGLVSICNSNSKRSGTSSLKSVYTVKNQSCWCQALEWWELIRYWMCRCWDFKHKLKHLKQLVTKLSTDMPP